MLIILISIEAIYIAPNFKVNDRVRITKYKKLFSKADTENWSREIFVIDFVLKSNPWTYKIKDLKEEKIIGSFQEKELLFSKLQISYYRKSETFILVKRI